MPMRIDIISAIPELLRIPFIHSIMQRAQDKGLVEINIINLREYGLGPHRQIDDYQYGGGAGMVMMIEPLFKCIDALKAEREYEHIIYMTPDGDLLNQALSNRLSISGNIMILCGHYKGIDDRLREHVITMEVSIGEYVLSGGELAAAVLVDSVARLIPGVLNDSTSALFDSFQDDLIAPPVYTRPEEFNGWSVPKILLSGHDKNILDWRSEQSLERTMKRKNDLKGD